jgi:hypothetical protein
MLFNIRSFGSREIARELVYRSVTDTMKCDLCNVGLEPNAAVVTRCSQLFSTRGYEFLVTCGTCDVPREAVEDTLTLGQAYELAATEATRILSWKRRRLGLRTAPLAHRTT